MPLTEFEKQASKLNREFQRKKWHGVAAAAITGMEEPIMVTMPDGQRVLYYYEHFIECIAKANSVEEFVALAKNVPDETD